MNVNKLTRLFDALGASPSKTQPIVETDRSTKAAAVVSSQAVKVSADFGKSKAVEAPAGDPRAAKIADIKARVDSGTYNPDNREVAKSLLKELFV